MVPYRVCLEIVFEFCASISWQQAPNLSVMGDEL